MGSPIGGALRKRPKTGPVEGRGGVSERLPNPKYPPGRAPIAYSEKVLLF